MRRIVTIVAAAALILSACTLPTGFAEPTTTSEVTTTAVVDLPHPSRYLIRLHREH